MAKTPRVTYKEALEVVYEHWVQFYDEREHYDLVWMLCDMFGLSEERVHEDLVALRAKERANA